MTGIGESDRLGAPHVIIIGGGLAGLSAAVALSSSGCRVSLLEKSPRLGGRASSYTLPDGEQIDNCQHVTLPCCTNLENFYKRIGVAEKIRYYERLVFAGSGGVRASIRAAQLPAPFHLAPSFTVFPLLSLKDKLAIARAMFSIVRSAGRTTNPNAVTMLEWLKRHKQTPAAIDRFWRIVLVSALNEDLDRMDASHGVAVFWKAFLSNRDGYRVGIPAVPLAELYAPSQTLIESAGGRVRTRCGVREIAVFSGAVTAIRLDDGTAITGDYYIAAVPFDRVLKLLPEEWRNESPFADLQNFAVSPITSVHLWFERPVLNEPFLAAVDQTIQWVFNKTRLCGAGDRAPQYLQVVISASRGLTHMSQQAVVDLVLNELRQIAPGSRGVEVKRTVVVREHAATFSPAPGSERWRLEPTTPIQGLFLAGDWTRTGWPATMESAVRSGYGAAEAILSREGRPGCLIQPELPVTGAARISGTSTEPSPFRCASPKSSIFRKGQAPV